MFYSVINFTSGDGFVADIPLRLFPDTDPTRETLHHNV